MEAWVGEGFECARRCLEARAGKDEETSLALTRAAGMYALKALGLLQEPFGGDGESEIRTPSPHAHQPWRGASR